MVGSLSNVQSSCHVRSNSLPSRPHPITSEVDQHLSRLRSSQATSTSSSSSSSICLEINGLQDLHDCVDKLLQLPLTHQALGQEQQNKLVNELLNGSLRILDVSSIAKDVLLQTKECAQELSSVLRGRQGDEISSEVKKYLTSRKAIKIKHTQESLERHGKQMHLSDQRGTVNEYFIKAKWLVIGFKASATEKNSMQRREVDMNEFVKEDAALIAHKTSTSDNIIQVLKELESNIQDLEDGLESLSRHLIKSRVSFLDILNN